jgi:hypothetical protein
MLLCKLSYFIVGYKAHQQLLIKLALLTIPLAQDVETRRKKHAPRAFAGFDFGL